MDENNILSKRILFISKSYSYLFLLPLGISISTSKVFILSAVILFYFLNSFCVCKSSLKTLLLQVLFALKRKKTQGLPFINMKCSSLFFANNSATAEMPPLIDADSISKREFPFLP